MKSNPSRSAAGVRRLAAEFIALYFLVPSALAIVFFRIPVLPLLWLAALACAFWLRRHPAVPPERGFRPRWGELPALLARWALATAVLAFLLWRWRPDLWLWLPRRHPRFWALLVLAYPFISVIPQGIVYRAFLFRRYGGLFANDFTCRIAAVLAFSFGHIVFRNLWALVWTAFGGILFVKTYRRTGSLALSNAEQWLYGSAIFTTGWGAWFLDGTVAALRAAVPACAP